MSDLKQQCHELAVDIVRQWFLRSCGDMNKWEKWKPVWEEQLTEQFEAFALTVWNEALEESAQAYERYRQSLIPKAGDWRPPQPFEDWLRQQAQLNQAQL